MRAAARISIVSFVLLLTCLPAFAGYDTYTDIHPGGWTESVAVCVNAAGDVVGYGVSGQGERGFLWSKGTVSEILPPGADSARAFWINANGDIAGTAVTAGVSHAFVRRGGFYLDPTPGWAFSTAVFVGDDGTVAGSGEFGAFTSSGGAAKILPGFSVILGGNRAGELIGVKDNAARLYVPGDQYFDLTPPTAVEAFPNAINDAGHVALTSRSEGVATGFIYSNGWFIRMTPSGWDSSQAMAVNESAAVVGFGDSLGTRRSFVRTGGEYEFVAFPGWQATEAVSINDAGTVAGSGLTASGARHAFVAAPAGLAPADSPAPAPESASGGVGCAMVAAGRPASADSAVNLIVLASPLLVLLGRRPRG